MSEYSLFHQRSHSVPIRHTFTTDNNSTLNYGTENPRTFNLKKPPPLKHDILPSPSSITTGQNILQFPSSEGFQPFPVSKSFHLNTPSSLDEEEQSPSNFFCAPKNILNIVDYDKNTINYPVMLNCKMDRGFFFTQSHWTCYRRNYFQVTSSLVIAGHSDQVRYALQLDSSDRAIIHQFSISLKACALTDPLLEKQSLIRPITLIQMTAKRDKGPQREPPTLAITPSADTIEQHLCVTFERLQFKVATANNGKRKASQQYFRLIFQLIAQLNDGSEHVVSECYSLPLVVRGRSPGHYAFGGQKRLTATGEKKKKRMTMMMMMHTTTTKNEKKREESNKDTSSLIHSHCTFNSIIEEGEGEEEEEGNQHNNEVLATSNLPYSQQQPVLMNEHLTNFHTRSQSANSSEFYERQQQRGTMMKYHYPHQQQQQPILNSHSANHILFDHQYDTVAEGRSLRMWQNYHPRTDSYPQNDHHPYYNNNTATLYQHHSSWDTDDDSQFIKQQEDQLHQQSSSK